MFISGTQLAWPQLGNTQVNTTELNQSDQQRIQRDSRKSANKKGYMPLHLMEHQ